MLYKILRCKQGVWKDTETYFKERNDALGYVKLMGWDYRITKVVPYIPNSIQYFTNEE